MRFKLAPFVLIASCLPAMADHLPSQGNGVSVSGRAHITKGALGTYIDIDNGGPSVTGYVPFGDGGAFPGLYDLDGRYVTVSGVVVWSGRRLIVMNNPAQLTLTRR